jgi:anaerobic magnesium-protoporphyrin IX monomethyl ester cyclase
VRAVPYYRTKSVERTVQEADLLVNRYRRTLLLFVDGTFELDPVWTDRFFDAILHRGLRCAFWTFSRADTLLRCEQAGTLEKGVRAGWRHVLIGAEHVDRDELAYVRKPLDNADRALEIVRLIARKYPQVVTHVTLIGGMPDDDRESLRRLYRYAVGLKCDIASLHFLTPLPGTDLHEEAKRDGLLKVLDYSQYSWFTPVMATRHLSIEDLDRFWSPRILTVNFHHPLRKLLRMLLGDPENRRIMRIGLVMSVRYSVSLLLMLFRRPGRKFRSFVTPLWHDT